jgi:hypothetical protein
MLPSSAEGEEKTSTQLGPLEIANLNQWSPEDGNIQFPKRRVSTTKSTGRWKKSKNPVKKYNLNVCN